MRKIIIIFLILFLNQLTFSQKDLINLRNNVINGRTDGIHRICINQKLNDPIEQKKINDNTKNLFPEGSFKKENLKSLYKIGEIRSFWVLNRKLNSYYQLNAQLMTSGNYVNIWLDTSEVRKSKITNDDINKIFISLESKTSNTSRDSTKGIVNLDIDYFGNLPNINISGEKGKGDGKLTVLLFDIIDDFETTQDYIAGYFDPKDQSVSSIYSNKCDMIYIDIYPTIIFQNKKDLTVAMQTSAHEIQHLINFNYDPNKLTFVNEACSQNAEVFCGFNVFNGVTESKYFDSTNVNLFSWKNELPDYSRATLWLLYIIEQVGDPITKSIVSHSITGVSGVNSSLNSISSKILFNDLFKNWAVANIINDINFNPVYGYKYSVKGSPSTLLFREANDTIISEAVNPLAIKYISFESQSKNFKIKFTSGNDLSIKLVEIGKTTKNILDILPNVEYSIPEFESDYEKLVFVLTNTSEIRSSIFGMLSKGERVWKVEEIAYDDGRPKDIGGFSYLQNPNPGNGWAVKFNPRFPKNKLLNSKLWIAFEQEFPGSSIPQNAPKQFQFHIWKALNDSTPGVDLIQPIVYAISRENTLPTSFLLIDLKGYTNILQDLKSPIFIGIIEDDEYPTDIALNDFTKDNFTYAKGIQGDGNWIGLNKLMIETNYGVVSLRGWNLMIRAQFEYEIPAGILRIEESPSFSLSQNYPNPFNPSTTIEYYLNEKSNVELSIYDLLGRRINNLVNSYQEIGNHQIVWNGKSENGLNLPSGIYYYKLKTNNKIFTKKMQLLK